MTGFNISACGAIQGHHGPLVGRCHQSENSFNSLPNNRLSKLQLQTTKCDSKNEKLLPAFSPFPAMFSKGFLYRVVKKCDCHFLLFLKCFQKASFTASLKVVNMWSSLKFCHHSCQESKQKQTVYIPCVKVERCY